MIRGSDGLEYADEAALLLREPIDNTFNGNVRSYRRIAFRRRGDADALWTEEKVRKYIEGFTEVCPDGYPGPSEEFANAHQAGLYAAGVSLLRPAVTSGFSIALERARLRALSGDDFGVITIDATTPAF